MNFLRKSIYLRSLRSRWIRWKSGTRVRSSGSGHCIEINEALLFGVDVEIRGHGNRLHIASGTRMWGGKIVLAGENLSCTIGSHGELRAVQCLVEDRSSRLEIGEKIFAIGCTLLAGEGRLLSVGRDCMIAAQADLRTTDSHSILDAETRARTNPAADVRLEDHVWIGMKALIMKGVSISTHSIIAAGAVVVRDVSANVISGGVPAKTLRTGVTWDKARLEVKHS